MKGYECIFVRGPYTYVQTRHGNRGRLDLIKKVVSISEGSVFQIKRSQQLSLCIVKLVKLLPVHRFIVDIFSYSGPSGILGSCEKQNTAKQNTAYANASGVRIVTLSISSHKQTQ